jgi:hypothetical protein
MFEFTSAPEWMRRFDDMFQYHPSEWIIAWMLVITACLVWLAVGQGLVIARLRREVEDLKKTAGHNVPVDVAKNRVSAFGSVPEIVSAGGVQESRGDGERMGDVSKREGASTIEKSSAISEVK